MSRKWGNEVERSVDGWGALAVVLLGATALSWGAFLVWLVVQGWRLVVRP